MRLVLINLNAIDIVTLLLMATPHEGEPISTIATWHLEARPFSDKKIGLVQKCAEQAAIASENTGLLDLR